MTITNTLSAWIAQNYLAKYQSAYFQKYKQKLPIVLITGNSGKSSTTLFLADYYRHLGYQVITGASQNSCYNSLTGLSMILGRFRSDFESSGAIFAKILFSIRSLLGLILPIKDLSEKTILVYECGFDHQGEAEYFVKAFQSGVQILVITNLGWEHSAGFENTFDNHLLSSLKSKIPQSWLQIFDSPLYPEKLKNIALEQMRLAKVSDYIIYPEKLNAYSNTIIDSKEKVYTLDTGRNADFSLNITDQCGNRYTYGKGYLLPKSIAKNILILQKTQEVIESQAEFQVGGSDTDQNSTAKIPEELSNSSPSVKILNTEIESKTVQTKKNTESNTKSKSAHKSLQEFLDSSSFPNGRFSIIAGKNQSTIVDSSYNADPDSVHGFLDILEEVILEELSQKNTESVDNIHNNSHKGKQLESIFLGPESASDLNLKNDSLDTSKQKTKHVLILGEMRELGDTAKEEHIKVLEGFAVLKQKYPEFLGEVILLGREWLNLNLNVNKDGESEDGKYQEIDFESAKIKVFTKGGEIYHYLETNNQISQKTWFWIKGSQNTIFLEGLVQKLLQNPEDQERLCRRGKSWDEKRKPFYE